MTPAGISWTASIVSAASFLSPATGRGVSIAPEALEQALPEVVAEVLSHNPDAIVLACSRAAFAPAALELARQKNTRPAITSYVNMIITEAFKIFDDVLGQYRLYAPSWVDYQNEHLHNLEEASEWLGDYAAPCLRPLRLDGGLCVL